MSGRLRIVSGAYGGRLITCPQTLTRPTTDRVREALFSSLTSMLGSFEGLEVCDAFAGSGALGLEALSRGAVSVTFFEQDQAVSKTLLANITDLNVHSQCAVKNADVIKRGISNGAKSYDVLFLDPPYATNPETVAILIQNALDAGELSADAVITYEHDRASTDPLALPHVEFLRRKQYGKTVIDFFQVSLS